MEIFLKQRLSKIASIPLGIALEGAVFDTETESVTALIYYRFEDDLESAPQFLAEVPAGQSFSWPIDLKGRAVRLFGVSKTQSGTQSVKIITEGEQVVFDPGASVIAGEDLLTNDLLNYYEDSGTTKARKADATDATKPAQAFAANDALTGALVRPLTASSDITGLTARTPGVAQYLSTTPGQMTESPPATVGNLVQKVGTALSTTSVDFNPETGAPVTSGGATAYPPSGLGLTDLGPITIHEQIRLNWTNNGGTGDNSIERSDGGAGFTVIATVAFGVSTYDDLTPFNGFGTDYNYRVRNVSVLGYSNEANITIP